MNYAEIAKQARIKVLEMIYKAQSSHIGSNLSAIDILAVLYNIANIDKDLKEDRDRIVISKGWIAASVYYFLSQKGIIPESDLDNFYKDGSEYVGLVEPNVRGIEAAGGSMGMGLPFGVGFALAGKKTYVLMGDGEMDCGTTWESALIAAHHKLSNLVVIIDVNGLQAMGEIKDVLNIEPLKAKWESFGWEVVKIDGHNYLQIEEALKNNSLKPKVVIARTIKGKGISFMENNNIFHYKAPSEDEYNKALECLK